MMVLALVTCERSFLKARHSLRNALPAGQQYSSVSSFQRGVANQAFRLDVELRFDPIDHRLGALDFCGSMSRCGFHIHDHAVLGIAGTCGSMFFSSTIQASIGAVR